VRFLALSAPAAWLLLGAIALMILLLHMLRPPRPAITVTSVLLWARTARERKRPSRRLVALLLALAAGLSLALALTRPEVPAIAPPAQRLTLILDNSASMAARTADGATRWQHALDAAHRLLQAAGAGSEVLLLDTRGKAAGSGPIDREAALVALDRMPGPGWGGPRIPSAAAMSVGAVHVFTDGVAPLDLPGHAIDHSVYEPAESVGLTAFEARPLTQDPTRYEALVQMVNAASGSRRARLLIQGDAGFSIVQDFDIGPGETLNAIFDVSEFEGGVLTASAIGAGDAFPLDDVAYAVIPPHRARRVLLVSAGNPALATALRNLPGVRLTVLNPAQYSSQLRHDAVVFDRFAPDDPPLTGALLLRPPPRDWLDAGRVQRGAARITSWDPEHPVSAAIDWRRVRLTSAWLEAPHPRAAPLVLAGQGSANALVIAGAARARWIKLGFALDDSNFALQPDFPVFLGNAIGWLGAAEPALVRRLGKPIEVLLPNGQVRDAAGTPLPAVATDHGVQFEAPRADVYTISAPGRQVQVVANVSGPHAALINATRLPADRGMSAIEPSSHWLRAELWVVLLLCAYLLLLVDWAVVARRDGAAV
jgi:hypothetical protein